ncbi:hypothetical protein D8W71_22335 [Rhodococcus sp. P1Y]|nr:hypothetical protein D8W71_22335 [Rhodococcus sp. P1Y]
MTGADVLVLVKDLLAEGVCVSDGGCAVVATVTVAATGGFVGSGVSLPHPANAAAANTTATIDAIEVLSSM